MKHILLASQYVGKEEKEGNSGFKDSKFEADMIKFGAWQKGFAWCSCFVRMIFIKSYPEKAVLYRSLIFPGTRQTFESLKGKGYSISSIPKVGDLVLWANFVSGKDTGKGHAAIVTEVLDDVRFKTIEGNGSANGSRNGDRVVEHIRILGVRPNGLNILGFITL